MNNARLCSLLTTVYTAAVDAGAWSVFLEQLSDTLRSTTTGLHYFDTANAAGSIEQFVRADPAWLRDYDNYYVTRNAFLVRGAHLFGTGVTLSSDAVLADHELRRTEWFNDYLHPHRIDRNIGACLFREQGLMTNFTVMRAGRSYTEQEVEFVRALVPHLQQALRVHRRLKGVKLQDWWSAALLDLLPSAVFLLDRRCVVLHMNDAAHNMLAESDGLYVRHGELRCAAPGMTLRLRAMIASALVSGAGPDDNLPQAPAVLRIERPSMRQSLTAVATPLTRRPFDLSHDARAAILVSDPERSSRLDDVAMARVFGLTPAEVRVLQGVLAGDTITRISETLHISVHTGRTHLKRVLAKTSCRRQSDLVARFSPIAVQAVLSARRA
jgi:DNA-binding CsgD family transcriptional regulator